MKSLLADNGFGTDFWHPVIARDVFGLTNSQQIAPIGHPLRHIVLVERKIRVQ